MIPADEAIAEYGQLQYERPNGLVAAVALSHACATDRTLYAGTYSGGVFRGVVRP